MELLVELSKTKLQPAPLTRLIPEPTLNGQTQSFDGTSIYWEVHGPKPTSDGPRPILFCYGLACSMNQWRAQLERYSPHRPCILFDYRGHHGSAFPEDPSRFNISALARDAAAVLHHLELTQEVHVFGHSLGVNVALELAASEPELCRSLILCCGTADNPFRSMFGTDKIEKVMTPILAAYPDKADYFDLAWRLMQARPGATALGARFLGFNMDASSLKDVETYAQSVASIDPQTFFFLLRDLSRGMTRGILPKIRVPTLAIAGRLDRVTPPESMKLIADALPNAFYVEIPAGSHNVQLDFGEYVALKAEEFWKNRKLD